MTEYEVSLFIKERIKEYSLEEIKKYLLENGATPQQIDDAIKLLITHPGKNRLDILFMAFFSVAVAICILIIIPKVRDFKSALSEKSPESDIVVYRGMGGYKLHLPRNYKFDRKKEKEGLETVTFYPDSLSLKSLTGRKKGVYRVNVIGRKTIADKPLDLNTMQKNHLALAKKKNLKFELAQAKDLILPAFIMRVYSPDEYTEIVMEGSENIYIFTSAYEEDTFYSIINSLVEY